MLHIYNLFRNASYAHFFFNFEIAGFAVFY